MAPGAERGPPGDHQCADRPERGAAASPHHLRAGQGIREVGRRRSRATACRGAVESIREKAHEFRPRALRCGLARGSTSLQALGRASHRSLVANVQHGRFERSLSGLTAFAAAVTTAEIYLEHYRASFGNKMMWSPIIVTPPVMVAGVGGVFSRKMGQDVSPDHRVDLHGQRPDRRVLPRPRGGPAAGRIRPGELQRGHGAADHGPGLMTIVGLLGCWLRCCDGRTDRWLNSVTCARPIICRTCASPRAAAIPRGCRVSARGVTPQMIGRYPDYDVMDNAENWDQATRSGDRGAPRRPRSAEILHRAGGADRCARSVMWSPLRTRSPGAGGRDGRREARRRASRRLSVRQHAATRRHGGWCCAGWTRRREALRA